MAITLELKPNIQAQLLKEAEANGLPINQYLENLIEGHVKASCRRTKAPSEVHERLMQLAKKWHALPTLDNRSPDQIIGYDEFGLPR